MTLTPEQIADLLDKLRSVEGRTTHYYLNPHGPAAADLIEAQAATIARLREALVELTSACEDEFGTPSVDEEPDDSQVALPESSITFGHLRKARAVIEETGK